MWPVRSLTRGGQRVASTFSQRHRDSLILAKPGRDIRSGGLTLGVQRLLNGDQHVGLH